MFLLLTLLCGIIINIPYHNFQDFLAQGDHGRDLYAAQAVLRGEVPYKDFWWVYGPLMPYYYGLFFKFLGTQVPSVLLGKAMVNIAAGAFFFLAFSRLFSAPAAFTAALWFMVFHDDFFFTYNHAGGMAAMMAVVWMHCAYIKTGRFNYAWGALVPVFILGLIKINFALVALLMTIALVETKERPRPAILRRDFHASGLLVVPLLWLGIYAWLVRGLSISEIRQCFPYLGGDEPYNSVGPLQTIPVLAQNIFHTVTSSWIDAAFCVLILLCAVQTFYVLAKKADVARRETLFLVLTYAALFYVLNLHEFLKSGVFYRSFWAQPFSMFLTFTVIATAASSLERRWQTLLWGVLVLAAGLGYWSNVQRIEAYKNPQHLLEGPRGGVYITDDPSWIQTVELTTKELNAQLKDNELFLALPYDCLYYYLTGKKTPTRQLIFFEHIHIPAPQEQKIIDELEANKIAAVLVSSRQSSHERGLGRFGVDYCPLIAHYIEENFTPVTRIGDWNHEAGWAWNHGTLIFKRKGK